MRGGKPGPSPRFAGDLKCGRSIGPTHPAPPAASCRPPPPPGSTEACISRTKSLLYRVVGVGAAGDIVELEDCLHLDVAHVPLADVRARRLRVVTPARAVTA